MESICFYLKRFKALLHSSEEYFFYRCIMQFLSMSWLIMMTMIYMNIKAFSFNRESLCGRHRNYGGKDNEFFPASPHSLTHFHSQRIALAIDEVFPWICESTWLKNSLRKGMIAFFIIAFTLFGIIMWLVKKRRSCYYGLFPSHEKNRRWDAICECNSFSIVVLHSDFLEALGYLISSLTIALSFVDFFFCSGETMQKFFFEHVHCSPLCCP